MKRHRASFCLDRNRRGAADGKLRHVAVPVAPLAKDHGAPGAQPDAHLEFGHRFRTDAHVGRHRLQQFGPGHDATEFGRRGSAQQLPQHL